MNSQPAGAIPRDDVTENALIGAVLILCAYNCVGTDWDLPPSVGTIRPEDFCQANAAQAWRMIEQQWRRNEPVDWVIAQALGIKAAYLAECENTCPTPHNVDWYVRRVKDLADRRRAIRAGIQQVQDAYAGKTPSRPRSVQVPEL